MVNINLFIKLGRDKFTNPQTVWTKLQLNNAKYK